MVLYSIKFWSFFCALLIPYFTVFYKCAKAQNVWLLLGSLVFYSLVDWRMTILLVAAIVIFYFLGLKVDALCQEQDEKAASRLTALAVVLGIAILVYFKYLGFCVRQFNHLLLAIGFSSSLPTLQIIMPLGISFFTFKLMGYVIEVHRETIRATRDIVKFGVFISFFPTIMSGPIDNPRNFLPQLDGVRTFSWDNVAEGFRRILWGIFLKTCIADLVSGYTDTVLSLYIYHNATTIILGAILYAFQLYADFAGYSHMTIGVSQVMGIKVAENFNCPYFAQNLAEFWRRWHMSLTNWITQYVFMPLNIAFRDWGTAGLYLATLINLAVIGAWHGANWTFLLFGLYHGLLLISTMALDKRRKHFEKQHNLKKNPVWKYSRILLTFFLWCVSLLCFLSPNIRSFLHIFPHCVSRGFGIPWTEESFQKVPALIFILVMMFKDYKDENKLNLHFLHSPHYWVRLVTATLLVVCILGLGSLDGASFIYYKF